MGFAMISEAFFSVCKNARPAKSNYISLYIASPYYGGPEEGGWWDEDTILVAYQKCDNQEQAEQMHREVQKLAEELTADAKRGFGQNCAAQCEWLESRGLESDALPEVDGEARYFVMMEETPGENTSQGVRHYE